jgi:hypothetical protein
MVVMVAASICAIQVLLMIMVFWLLGAPKHHDHEVGGGNARPI